MPAKDKVNMRELNCVITPNSQGWLLIVGTRRRGWFPSKDTALRAAIGEVRRGREAGFYSSVKVQHVRKSVPADGRVGSAPAVLTTATNVSDRSVFWRSNPRFPFGSMQPPKR